MKRMSPRAKKAAEDYRAGRIELDALAMIFREEGVAVRCVPSAEEVAREDERRRVRADWDRAIARANARLRS